MNVTRFKRLWSFKAPRIPQESRETFSDDVLNIEDMWPWARPPRRYWRTRNRYEDRRIDNEERTLVWSKKWSRHIWKPQDLQFQRLSRRNVDIATRAIREMAEQCDTQGQKGFRCSDRTQFWGCRGRDNECWTYSKERDIKLAWDVTLFEIQAKKRIIGRWSDR